MESLRIFSKNLRIICLTLLWLLALIFMQNDMAIALDHYKYYPAHDCDYPNTSDSNPTPGVMLIGGAESGADGEKEATQWFLDRADKGDYLVIRYGEKGSQADWICRNFPSSINSAGELTINTREGANSKVVENYIRNADALFIAEGKQDDYVETWEGTYTEDAINYLINDKKVPSAGTSAGMAILGEYYYSPRGKGLVSSEILDDPFHPNTDDINGRDFIDIPILRNTITDTHLDRLRFPQYKETRYGRILGLLARVVDDNSLPSYAIGAEEGAFIAIDEDGIATVFGNGTNCGEDAYFLRAETEPERIKKGRPLIWKNDRKAVKVYRIQGTPEGSGQFNLNDWESGKGGESGYWYTRYDNAGFRHCP